MNIDNKIKQELERESAEIDRILALENGGLTAMLQSGLSGSMRRWFVLINIITVLVSLLLLWCGYQFFTATASHQVFWGVSTVLCLQVQIAMKQWLYGEMGRSSLIREVKRVELAVAELEQKISKH